MLKVKKNTDTKLSEIRETMQEQNENINKEIDSIKINQTNSVTEKHNT